MAFILWDDKFNFADFLVLVLGLGALWYAVHVRNQARRARQNGSGRSASPEVVGRALQGAETPGEHVTILLDTLVAGEPLHRGEQIKITDHGDVRPGDRTVPKGDAYWRRMPWINPEDFIAGRDDQVRDSFVGFDPARSGNGANFSWWIIDDPAGGPVIDTTAREASSQEVVDRYEAIRRGEE